MWNTDAHQFFLHANAAAAAAAASAAAASSQQKQSLQMVLQHFAERQDLAEDEQDLVMHRTCYFFSQNDGKRQTSSETSEAMLAAAAAAGIKDAAAAASVTVQQLYITFWPAVCLAGMVYTLMQFVLFYRGQGNGISGIGWTEHSMTKHAAMLLCCIYAALAWTLSNGLVLNPRKDLAFGEHKD